MQQATLVAAEQGADWVDVQAALSVVDDPDTPEHDYRYHVYDLWRTRQHGHAPERVSLYFELMGSLPFLIRSGQIVRSGNQVN